MCRYRHQSEREEAAKGGGHWWKLRLLYQERVTSENGLTHRQGSARERGTFSYRHDDERVTHTVVKSVSL